MSFLNEMTSLCLFMSAITVHHKRQPPTRNAVENSQDHQLGRDGHQLLHARVRKHGRRQVDARDVLDDGDSGVGADGAEAHGEVVGDRRGAGLAGVRVLDLLEEAVKVALVHVAPVLLLVSG